MCVTCCTTDPPRDEGAAASAGPAKLRRIGALIDLFD